MKQSTKNAFNDAQAYNGYIGRWSKLIAGEFIDWLHIPTEQNWLDVGAGTGYSTQQILQQASPKKIMGIDLSEAYIERAQQDVVDTRVEFKVIDVGVLAAGSLEFDVAVAGLVLNFVPSPRQTLQSMKQLVKPGDR